MSLPEPPRGPRHIIQRLTGAALFLGWGTSIALGVTFDPEVERIFVEPCIRIQYDVLDPDLRAAVDYPTFAVAAGEMFAEHEGMVELRAALRMLPPGALRDRLLDDALRSCGRVGAARRVGR